MEEKPLVIGGKSYISSKRAAVLFDYTTDYIGQLSRSKKIGSVMVGRDRFIDYSSLVKYVDSITGSDVGAARLSGQTGRSGGSEPSLSPVGGAGVRSLPGGPRLPIPVSGVKFWATSIGALVGLFMFFFLTPLGAAVVGQFRPDFSNLAIEQTALAKSATPEFLSSAGSFFSNVDRVYLGFLRSVEGAIVKLWKDGSTRFVAFLGPFWGAGRTETVVVREVQAPSVSPVAKVPEDSKSDPAVPSGLSEAEVRVIAKQIIDDELSRTIDYSSRPASSNLGVVVKPGTGDPVYDATIVDRIKSSFSDEVRVTVDQSRSSGVIRPVFRDSTDDYYHFILVPIEQP